MANRVDDFAGDQRYIAAITAILVSGGMAIQTNAPCSGMPRAAPHRHTLFELYCDILMRCRANRPAWQNLLVVRLNSTAPQKTVRDIAGLNIAGFHLR